MTHPDARLRWSAVPIALLASLSLGPASLAGADGPTFNTSQVASSARTEVRDADGKLVAELTGGARLVTLRGPARRFGEPGLAATVTTDRWARLLPAAFDGAFDAADASWLAAALADRSPDILAVAFQYVTGAPDGSGLGIAGDARYGPAAGADFNDYLGVRWAYGTTVDAPEKAELRSLDCSGFVRMVFGYRFGMRMALSASAGALPRRAADQLTSGPGQVTVANAGRQVVTFDGLRAGDLVFFDASSSDGALIDHVGIYLGRDLAGHHRFISSRKLADGPTIGDVGGASTLDGSGYWARAFRASRRP